MNKEIIITKSLKISDSSPCFIIAEAGINHDGSLEKAKELVDVAKESGADAVKFQMFNTNKYISKDAFYASYMKKGLLNKKEKINEFFKRLEVDKNQLIEIQNYAKKKKILFLCTPFDSENGELLNRMGVPIFKIASFSLTNTFLLESIAKHKKPIIMSTGLHTISEIENAYNILIKSGKPVAILQCTSHYPIRAEEANLNVMKTFKNAFGCLVGYSDHSMGINIPLAAVALGAKIIEKHFTLEQNDFGADHDASANPKELKDLVSGIREIEKAFGSSQKIITKIEKEVFRVHRPSLISKVFIKKGTRIKKTMLDMKKPGTGINPLDINWVIGRKTKKNILKDRLIIKKHLD
jgi:N-acetylneuraminate synthase/N,N'-diacetyllegionaminate synthase